MSALRGATPNSPERMRLDKWLWAVRFFKTRALAVEAIEGGKVQVEEQRAKPGKEIHVGSRVEIHKESLIWKVQVMALPRQRGPAGEAVLCYREEEESVRRRDEEVARRRLEHSPQPEGGRPTKRDRRRIHRFTGLD